MRLRRCAATPHPALRATFPPGGRLEGCGIQRREAIKGKALGDGGRREKRLPWLGQAAAGASAPVNAGTVLLSDNDDKRLCPRENAANHCRV